MPRAIFLCLAACATALHVQRRALLAPAVAGAIGIAPANAGLIDFDPEAAKAAGRARAEQRRAEQKAFEDMGHLNSNVSTLTQTIYDALRKTMPCAWDGEAIVVLGEVRIPPPYTPEACQGNAGSTALQRVQKVLAGEVAKLATA